MAVFFESRDTITQLSLLLAATAVTEAAAAAPPAVKEPACEQTA